MSNKNILLTFFILVNKINLKKITTILNINIKLNIYQNNIKYNVKIELKNHILFDNNL